MSVLKIKRNESKAEFVYTANQIFIETMQFLSRLSARYSRLLANNIIELAHDVLDNAEKANSIFPSDELRKKLREEHLLKSRSSLMALDIKLSHCYNLMLTNPQGCFTNSSGKTVSAKDATKKLENMAQSLGEKIDKENILLTNLLKSDKQR